MIFQVSFVSWFRCLSRFSSGRIADLFLGLSILLFVSGCSPKGEFCSSEDCKNGAAILAFVAGSAHDGAYEPGEEMQGGPQMTSYEFGPTAFRQFAKNAPLSSISEFTVGQTVFEVPWTPGLNTTIPDRDGLGPFFHTNSCLACHAANGRAMEADGDVLTTSLVRLSVGDDSQNVEPNYGGQFQPNSVGGVAKEGDVIVSYREIAGKFQDSGEYVLRSPTLQFSNLGYGPFAADVRTSIRVTQQVIGLGLLEAIPESTILSLADPDDKDGNGISGRPNYVRAISGVDASLGRFGWKANNTDLMRQNSAAFLGDLGITTPMFSNENCTGAQTQCQSAANGGSPEVSQSRMNAITNYMKLVAVPARRKADNGSVLAGKEIFFKAGCKNCHVPKLQTGPASFPELSNQTIRPYTDLLLHDMGEGLADNRPDELANGREWRTPPLWGIGLFEVVNGHTRYLHDGRASNLIEAVLWHGGEAEASRNYILKLDIRDRTHLVNFLKSL
ncbi:di-heme oxidoredictase family protein [Leptospira yasudae]|uniref:Thiol oxidoreductase n=1 Tax=Leptospira yasudae TaxID=2202201 RepID=A0ABX9M1N9_9LEPT|nr:di-heme oxidoredictase family protein [Leptospira yasudae]RHX79217.1 thiol oxidoreductase [Leptospira yasudae]